MKKAILGKKLGMTQQFLPDGRLVPVTVVLAGPCTVVQKKTAERDGYEAVQLSFDEVPEHRAKKLVNRPLAGHYRRAGVSPARVLREFRLADVSKYSVGQTLSCAQFIPGELVDVTGTTRGRGFTGVIYRWNGSRGPIAHGSKFHRAVGSMSAHSDPSRVFKNKKMSGQYGVERVTVQNLEIVAVDAERNLLLIKGAVPGPRKSLLLVRDAVKA